MESYFTNKNLFNLILKWKIYLAIIVLFAGICAIVFSSPFFIEPKFESSAILYPASPVTFSDESETEQMLEILASSNIMFQIIDAFDLAKHYDIDTEDRAYIHKITRAYRSNVSFNKTANEAVEISVRDKDPGKASAIVDSLISFYNQKLLDLNKQKSIEHVVIFRDEMIERQKEIDSLSRVLTKIRKEYGILHMPSQVEIYTEAITMGRGLNEARDVLTGWKKMGAEYQKTDSLFFYAISDFHKNKVAHDKSVRDTQKIQTYTHVVSSPFPADKKVYPVRWAIVLFSMLGAFFAGLLVISLIEGQKAKIEKN